MADTPNANLNTVQINTSNSDADDLKEMAD